MPLNAKGTELLAKFRAEYGSEGEGYFYAAVNKGTITGIDADEDLDNGLAVLADAMADLRGACDAVMPRLDRHVDRLIARHAERGDGAFDKLENKLSHEKGVRDPAAVAAAAGRVKLGEAEMARRAAAGRKDDDTERTGHNHPRGVAGTWRPLWPGEKQRNYGEPE